MIISCQRAFVESTLTLLAERSSISIDDRRRLQDDDKMVDAFSGSAILKRNCYFVHHTSEFRLTY